MNFSSSYKIFISCISIIFQSIYLISFFGELLSSFVYVIISCVGIGITTLMSISDRSDPYLFLSKDGKNAVHEGRNGRRGVYFTPESELSLYRKHDSSTFHYLYLDLACKQLCLPPRKGINRRNESTNIMI